MGPTGTDDYEREVAAQRAEDERQATLRTHALLGMVPREHLDRAAQAYARGGDTNQVVVELLFCIAKGGVQSS